MLRRIPHFIVFVVLLNVYPTVNASGQGEQRTQTYAVEKQLKNLYEKLLLASKTKDEAVLRQILTNNYSQVTADGRVRTKAIRLKETMLPDHTTELLVLESFDVFVYTNAAVARCLVRNKGAFRGEAFDVKILSTATFVKEGNVWRIAATHLSFVKPTSEQK